MWLDTTNDNIAERDGNWCVIFGQSFRRSCSARARHSLADAAFSDWACATDDTYSTFLLVLMPYSRVHNISENKPGGLIDVPYRKPLQPSRTRSAIHDSGALFQKRSDQGPPTESIMSVMDPAASSTDDECKGPVIVDVVMMLQSGLYTKGCCPSISFHFMPARIAMLGGCCSMVSQSSRSSCLHRPLHSM